MPTCSNAPDSWRGEETETDLVIDLVSCLVSCLFEFLEEESLNTQETIQRVDARQGFPNANVHGGISSVTTLPEPMTTPSPRFSTNYTDLFFLLLLYKPVHLF